MVNTEDLDGQVTNCHPGDRVFAFVSHKHSLDSYDTATLLSLLSIYFDNFELKD